MGVECSKRKQVEYEDVDIAHMLDDEMTEEVEELLVRLESTMEEELEEGQTTHQGDEKISHITKKTTRQHWDGCCGRGGRADLYITKIKIKHSDGRTTKFMERRKARHTKDGARQHYSARFRKEISADGKKGNWVKLKPNDFWPRIHLDS